MKKSNPVSLKKVYQPKYAKIFTKRLWDGDFKTRVQRMWFKMYLRCQPYYQKYKGTQLRLTVKEFTAFAEEHRKEIENMIEAWLKSGRDRRLCPTVDRIDSEGHYEIGNMRFLTLSENTRQYCFAKREKKLANLLSKSK